ncbi:DUF4097 family beta strand repeat-containing protein [Nocardiopsis exhalans]|uniref:DUF4097 family beta strand repeat-containing protein n=1 Tax=Nocardiopsis exhalans TaxID=163604 RepID=A0ABY5CZT3_9ACTN|nr:DUF4097 family beta strand repeat-containing protein [Nocardiopsis exhalans]USY17389.1 DUF4097 family beta strand repeat-containing protein [Nocardiopsis exhalans]
MNPPLTPSARSVFTIGGALLALALLTGCGQNADLAGSETRTEEKTYDDVPELLLVEIDDASLEIVPHEADQIRVVREETGSAGGDWELTGNTLDLEMDCGTFSDCRVRYEVFVPADTALSVETDNGDVSVSGSRAPTEVRSGNGTIAVSDVTGPLTLTSANGDMNLSGIGSESLSAATGNGTIDAVFSEAPAEVEVSTNNGAATLALPGGPYAVFETFGNGEVTNELPSDDTSASTVTARTDNGTITLVPTD